MTFGSGCVAPPLLFSSVLTNFICTINLKWSPSERYRAPFRGSRQIWAIKVYFQLDVACNQDNVPSFSEQPFLSILRVYTPKSNCTLFCSLNDICAETFDKRKIKIWWCRFLNVTKTRCKRFLFRGKSLRRTDRQKVVLPNHRNCVFLGQTVVLGGN